MARYTFGMTATIAGTSLRPIGALLNTASVTGVLREVGVFNTTSTACIYKLVRFTGGTAGADQSEVRWRRGSPAASCVAKAGWTADASSVDDDNLGRFELGALAGSGAILTFGGEGIETHDVGTTKGIGLIPSGTGQIVEFYYVWDE